MRRIMAGGVVAGQNAHMESLLAEEEEAQREVALLAAMGGDTNSKGVEVRNGERKLHILIDALFVVYFGTEMIFHTLSKCFRDWGIHVSITILLIRYPSVLRL